MQNAPMPDRRHPHVVNLDELELGESSHGRFTYRAARVAIAAGGQRLGCSVFEVAPGKTTFPFHWHAATEEAIYVLSGTGTLRLGDERIPVRAGDYIAFPCGPDKPHQLLADGDAPLRYLCFSARSDGPTEIVGYPDSKKFGMVVMGAPGQPPTLRKLFRDGTDVDYFDGEE